MSTRNAQSVVSSESHVYVFLFSVTGFVDLKQRQGRFEAGILKNEISAPLQIRDPFDLKSKKFNIRPSGANPSICGTSYLPSKEIFLIFPTINENM